MTGHLTGLGESLSWPLRGLTLPPAVGLQPCFLIFTADLCFCQPDHISGSFFLFPALEAEHWNAGDWAPRGFCFAPPCVFPEEPRGGGRRDPATLTPTLTPGPFCVQVRLCAQSSAPRRKIPSLPPVSTMRAVPREPSAAPGVPAAGPVWSPSWVRPPTLRPRGAP